MATRLATVYRFARRSQHRLRSRSGMTFKFIGRLRNPAMLGAVAPSSRALAELIVSEINPGDGDVIEVGAGTGVFTAALLARGVPAQAITLIEADPVFASLLRRRYPDVEVLQGFVEDILAVGGPQAGRRFANAISGLPLLNFPMLTRRRILAGIFDHLVGGGVLYQFTYGPRAPIDNATLAELGLLAQPVGRIWRNLPPATVYRISRRTVLQD